MANLQNAGGAGVFRPPGARPGRVRPVEYPPQTPARQPSGTFGTGLRGAFRPGGPGRAPPAPSRPAACVPCRAPERPAP
jgi:hypothetical protein